LNIDSVNSDFFVQSSGPAIPVTNSFRYANSNYTFSVLLKTTGGSRLAFNLAFLEGPDEGALPCVFTVVLPSAPEAPSYVPPDPYVPEAPSFRIVATSVTKFTPGKGKLEISIQRISGTSYSAFSLFLDPSDLGNDIRLDYTTANLNLTGSSVLVTVPLVVSETAKTGTYSLGCTITGLYGSSISYTKDQVITLSVDNTLAPANLSIKDAKTRQNEDVLSLDLTIANSGAIAVTDAIVSFEGISTATIYPDSTLGQIRVPTVPARSQVNLTVSFRIAEECASGTYPITAQFVYSVGEGKQTDSAPLFLPIQKGTVPEPESSGSVSIESASMSPNVIGDSNKGTLTLVLRNTSTQRLSDVSVTLMDLAAEGFSQYADFGPVKLSEILGGGTASVSYQIYVSSSRPTGNYPIHIKSEYSVDGSAVVSEATAFVTLNRPVEKIPTPPDVGNTGKPRMILSHYEFDRESIQVGETFLLSFTIQNTSETTSLQNIKLVLSSDGTFMPSAGSNTFYFASIPAGGSLEESVSLVSKRDIESKAYALTFSLEYEDKDNRAFTSEENVSIPVILPVLLEMTNTFVPEMGMSGNPLDVSFQFINKGRANIENLTIVVEGDFSAELGDYFYGRLAVGGTDFYEGSITPLGEGELSGAIVLKYEDANATPLETRYDFTMFVEGYGGGEWIPDDPIFVDPGMDPYAPEETGKTWAWYVYAGIGAGVLVIALIITLSIVKKKKAKKAAVSDNEDD
jgi:hypothetical protein